jgi:hypothetical protein
MIDSFTIAFDRCRGRVPADIDLSVLGAESISTDLGLNNAEELQRKSNLVGLIDAEEAYDGLTVMRIEALKAGRHGQFSLEQLTIMASDNLKKYGCAEL